MTVHAIRGMLILGDYDMPIKIKLKRELALAEMSQVELSNITGIRLPTISALCTNRAKHIPINVLEKICTTLNCQPGDIIKHVDDTGAQEIARERWKEEG